MSSRSALLAAIVLLGAACGGGSEVVVAQRSSPVPIDIDRSADEIRSPTSGEPVDGSDSTSELAPGRSTAITSEQRRVEEAAFFRLSVVNQTGQQHLSLSDYAAIRDEACGGAVNNPEELVELSRQWGLGTFSGDEAAAGMIWRAARNTCPEVFDDQDFSNGPPPFGNSGSGQQPGPSGEPPIGAQVSFIDVSVLDDPQWGWSGDQMTMFATTSLSPAEAVEHFRGAFSDGWTVNEVLGPVTAISGSTFWSLDISGDGFSGVVEVTRSDDDTTFVFMVVVDPSYPLSPFVVDKSPAIDGNLDCLSDFGWNQHSDFGADASGPADPKIALEEALDPYIERFGLDSVNHVRSQVATASIDGREVVVASAIKVPAGGYRVSTIQSCEPYPFS